MLFRYLSRCTRPRISTRLLVNRSGRTLFAPNPRAFFGTGTIAPRGLFFRLFWTGTTATVGYVYYKIDEAKNWISQKTESFADVAIDGALGLINAFTVVSDTIEELKASLPSLSFGSKKRPIEEQDKKHRGASSDSDDVSEERNSNGGSGKMISKGVDEFKDFIKRMIEIKNILKNAKLEETLTLPNIVVIGSQSSGKSSVLESIVGHEFLPKGQNMVTRRPLELTLVNNSTASKDYAIFPQLPDSKPIFDFQRVKNILTELNLAVPENQWISDKPIELVIHSKNIPDLSLVDLPGYIQLSSKDQPASLRQKIRNICEKYIKGPNIILAVCPADVDLANAEALQASRIVDPKGERTIGVITKLDLVEPAYAQEILSNDDYPLGLGYIGVICKQGQDVKIDSKEQQLSANISSSTHPFGIGALREKLTDALEGSLSASLDSLLIRAQDELAEVRYQLKVEYNDRLITPEGYMAYLINGLQCGFEEVAKTFGRAQVRELLRSLLQQQVLTLAAQHYSMHNIASSNEKLDEKHKADMELQLRLERSVAALTRSGVGKQASQAMVEAIMASIEKTIMDGPLKHHPVARERLLKHVEETLRRRCRLAIEQVENALKPFKYALEYTLEDWIKSREQTLLMLQREEKRLSKELTSIQNEVGVHKLRKAVKFLGSVCDLTKDDGKGDKIDLLTATNSPFSLTMLERAKQAVQLNFKLCQLRDRYSALSLDECSKPVGFSPNTEKTSGWWWGLIYGGDPKQSLMSTTKTLTFDPCQYKCPEIYLNLVAEKLVEASALFVHFELVHEFLHPLPDELVNTISGNGEAASTASRALGSASSSNVVAGGRTDVGLEGDTPLSGLGLDRAEMLAFVRENLSIARHLDLQERKRALDRVCEKVIYLRKRKEEQRQQASYSRNHD